MTRVTYDVWVGVAQGGGGVVGTVQGGTGQHRPGAGHELGEAGHRRAAQGRTEADRQDGTAWAVLHRARQGKGRAGVLVLFPFPPLSLSRS